MQYQAVCPMRATLVLLLAPYMVGSPCCPSPPVLSGNQLPKGESQAVRVLFTDGPLASYIILSSFIYVHICLFVESSFYHLTTLTTSLTMLHTFVSIFSPIYRDSKELC